MSDTSSLPKVVITDLITEPLDHERGVLDGSAEIVALDAMSEDELIGKIEDAEGRDGVSLLSFYQGLD